MADVISSFMERYNKEFDFYSNLSKKTASQLYDYIIKAIVNVFTDDAINVLEKCSNDINIDIEISEKAKSSLFRFIKSIYFGTSNISFVESVIDDYDSNNLFFYSSKEDALLDTKASKKIAFSKSDEDIIAFFDEYLDLKNQLTTENFSREMLDNLIVKAELLFNSTSRIQN